MLDSPAMARNLVIVESPAKAKTIERYLGPDYTVLASYGHVRDLPENPGKGKFGVDVDHDFAPEYVVPDDRRKQVDQIAKAAKRSDAIYLATDLDREGEAIAWHVAEATDMDPAQDAAGHVQRDHPGRGPRRVRPSRARSTRTWSTRSRPGGSSTGSSATRSARSCRARCAVACRPVACSRSRSASSSTASARSGASSPASTGRSRSPCARPTGVAFTADLVRIDGEPAEIAEGESAETHAAALRTAQPVVDKTGTRPVTRSPAAPFTTSTLQQEASRKLGFSPKRTMSVAQRLYEGVETGDGQTGLITYMRTDSTAIAGVAMGEARDVIGERYGPRYTMPKGRVYKTKSKGAQEAHESIRPTSFQRDPESMAEFLKSDEARLYRLIWQRAIASQMAAKEMETSTIELTAGRYGLRSTATRTVFDGFSRVYTEGRDDETEDGEEERTAPVLAVGDRTTVDEVRPTQHFTEPPPRYTEATLIKALEEHGIGRPSTYAATISTITDRGYVKVVEKRCSGRRSLRRS